MSEETDNVVGYAPARQPEEGVRKRNIPRRIALIAFEILLVAVIVGLLVATWLPAIIGANPDAPRNPVMP